MYLLSRVERILYCYSWRKGSFIPSDTRFIGNNAPTFRNCGWTFFTLRWPKSERSNQPIRCKPPFNTQVWQLVWFLTLLIHNLLTSITTKELIQAILNLSLKVVRVDIRQKLIEVHYIGWSTLSPQSIKFPKRPQIKMQDCFIEMLLVFNRTEVWKEMLVYVN